jgi:hypothetical protein
MLLRGPGLDCDVRKLLGPLLMRVSESQEFHQLSVSNAAFELQVLMANPRRKLT